MTKYPRLLRRFLLVMTLFVWGCGTSLPVEKEFLEAKESPPLLLSGTLEATEVTLAFEIGGKVVWVGIEEGDSVTAGSPLIRLDDRLLLEQQAQAQAALKEAEAALSTARAQLTMALAGARRTEIAAARSAVAAAEAQVDLVSSQVEAAKGQRDRAAASLASAKGQLEAAKAGLKSAQAQQAAAEAALAKGQAGATPEEIAIAERNLERAKNELWAQQNIRDAVCGRQQDLFETTCNVAQARVQAAEEAVTIAQLQLWQVQKGLREEDLATLASQVDAARAGVEAAQAQIAIARAQVEAAEATLRIAEADVASAEAQLAAAKAQRDQAKASLDLLLEGARPEEIAILRAAVARAEANVENARSLARSVEIQIEKSTLVAPISGTVVSQAAHIGELVTPGMPVVVLADLSKLTLTVYVPQPDLGKIHLNQQVEIRVDAYDDVFTGRVAHIASKAEFTPTNVETREERVNMVFPIKIEVENSDGRLKPGMPADATFSP